MLSEILAAVAGGVATGACSLFAEDIKEKLPRKRGINRDLLGKWNCAWTFEGQSDKLIRDYVEISKIARESIVAQGRNTAAGNYKLVGRFSQSYLLTLTYSGEDKRSALGGVVILELNASRDRMLGYWYEYSANRQFVGGQVMWEKA